MNTPIAVLVEPSQPSKHPTEVSHRVFHEVDQFAAALSRAWRAPVPVLEVPLIEAPHDGLIVAYVGFDLPDALSPIPPDERAALCRRMILMNADRSNVVRLVEEFNLAGAVEKHRYFLWYSQPERERGDGLYGRKDVAARLGIPVLDGPLYESPHYAWMESDRHADLPALMAAYLAGYTP